MIREIILRASKSKTTPLFDLNRLEEAGRMDVIASCISNSLFVSHHVRRDTIIHVVMEGPDTPPKIITYNGEKIHSLDFSERKIAESIQIALKKGQNLNMNESIESTPGITITKNSFESLIKERTKIADQLIYLHKKGQDIREMKLKNHILIVFGDYIGMPKKTEKFLDRFNPDKVSLGPVMLFASHCMILFHNELDRI